MIEVRHLVKRFSGVTAVNDVSFRIEPGQVLGCLGPNGSGKSTTVNMVVGLLEPSQGQVFSDGHGIQDDLMSYRRHVRDVPEEPNLYPFLSGREYLELVGHLRGMPAAALREKAPALPDLFGLGCDSDAAIGSYTKGMRQKVLISQPRACTTPTC